MPNPAEQAQRIEESCHPTPGPVRAEVGALTHRGRVRDANEDAFAVFRMGRYLERVTTNVPEAEFPSRCDEAGHVMIVADGLGGHEAGDVASRSALVNTFQFILRSPGGGPATRPFRG